VLVWDDRPAMVRSRGGQAVARPPNDPTASAVSLPPEYGEWTGAVNRAIHPCAVPTSSTRQR
jgi:hypothetical protein